MIAYTMLKLFNKYGKKIISYIINKNKKSIHYCFANYENIGKVYKNNYIR